MSEQLQNLLTKLRECLSELYGERLYQTILFGSEARGEATIDLLHKSEKLTISNFGFWILDFGLRDLGLLQEV